MTASSYAERAASSRDARALLSVNLVVGAESADSTCRAQPKTITQDIVSEQ
jgi:hypothetical protein